MNISPSWTINKKGTKTFKLHVCAFDYHHNAGLDGLATNMKRSITHHCVRTCAHTHSPTHTLLPVWVGLPLEQTHSVKQSCVVYSLITSCCWLAGPNSKKGHSRTRLGSVSVYILVFLCGGVEAPTSAQSKHVSRLSYISNSRLTDVWLQALFWTLSHVSSSSCTRVPNITHLNMFTSSACLCLFGSVTMSKSVYLY